MNLVCNGMTRESRFNSNSQKIKNHIGLVQFKVNIFKGDIVQLKREWDRRCLGIQGRKVSKDQ